MGVVNVAWSIALALLLSRLVPVAANNDTQPTSIFRSRPDLVAPIVTIFNITPEKVTPGYFFIAPYQQTQDAPHIFDNYGNLVWSGFGAVGPGISHSPQVCNYHGEPHLCFYQGAQMAGWGQGHGIIMDKHYRIVRSVQPASYSDASDMHEFVLLRDGKSALMTQYLRSAADLCDYGICNGLGYIQQGAFQEVDVETGHVLFEWGSLDHIDPSESYLLPGTTEVSGDGRDPQSPWDYFHINSIDKNADGDYLISARHVSAVYKISGQDGHIIWRLNGARSDFQLVDFQFSFQHDAQFVSDNASMTVISLFDNGSNGFNYTQEYSLGLVIAIDHISKYATLLRQYPSPELDGGRQMSKSQGNTQILPNGNVVQGWGNNAFWSEHLEDGTAVWYGSIGWENVMNYRAHKFNWTGEPLTRPAIWTYSPTRSDKMMIYISWNGATEVQHWTLYSSNSKSGPWEQIATVEKGGFETIYRHDVYAPYTYAAAIDKHGKTMRKSDVYETFVPSDELRASCDELACFNSLAELAKEQRPEGERLQQEEDERLRLEAEQEAERLRLEAEVKAVIKYRRRREWYIVSLCGIVGTLLILSALVARNSVAKHVSATILYFDDLYGRAVRRIGSSRGSYKELSTSEHLDSGIALDVLLAR